jgi:hypothetical protein
MPLWTLKLSFAENCRFVLTDLFIHSFVHLFIHPLITVTSVQECESSTLMFITSEIIVCGELSICID